MKTGPQNGIIGDDYGTELPVTQVLEQDLSEERNAARFSQTKEYQRLKKHLEDRIVYFQTFLPNGDLIVAASDPEQLGREWKVANAIITEFKAVLHAYEQARETVADADRRAAADSAE